MAEGGALREILAVFGFEVEKEGLEKGEKNLQEFAEKVEGIAKTIVGAFAVKELWEFAENTARSIHEVERSAVKLGISAKDVQLFQFAAKSAGEDSETLLQAMSRMQAVAGGNGKAFAALGIHTKDANGQVKDAKTLFLEVADAIHKEGNANKQAAIARAIFGRGGLQLLPILKEGREGIEGLGEEFKKLGGGYSKDAIEKTKELHKQTARMGLAAIGLRSAIAEKLFPALGAGIEKVKAFIETMSEFASKPGVVEGALTALEVALVGFGIKVAIANAPFLLMVAALGLLVLAVEDFIGTLEGKKSVLGDLLGSNTDPEKLKQIRDFWQGIKDAVAYIASKWEVVRDVLGKIREKTAEALVDESTVTGGVRAAMDRLRGKQTVREQALEDVGRRNAIAISESKITGEKPNLVTFPGLSMHDVAQATGYAAGSGIRSPMFGPELGPVVVNMHYDPNASVTKQQEQANQVAHAVKKAQRQQTQEVRATRKIAPQGAQ